MATAAVTQKALKLLEQSRVRIDLTGEGCTAQVRGDTGDREVLWDGGKSWRCSCDCTHSRCSHTEAVKIALRAFGIATE